MSYLYLAIAECGEYDDWSQWPVGVFTTRSKAKKGCEPIGPTKKMTWAYNAKTGESTALSLGKRSWETVGFTISRIEVDVPI